MSGEPLAYIIGHKEFYGLEFKVNKHTLIPRPETETLIDHMVDTIHEQNLFHDPMTIIDIGTGSGNIIISLLETLRTRKLLQKNHHFFGLDISQNALRVAKINAQKLTAEKIHFQKSHLLTSFLDTEKNTSNVKHVFFLANLPYVPTQYLKKDPTPETLGLSYEPLTALDGGSDGLDYYRALTKQICTFHKKNSCISIRGYYEIDPEQKTSIEKFITSALPNAHIIFLKDLSNKVRYCSFMLDISL
jgi:release factor glutamine methyltransferase